MFKDLKELKEINEKLYDGNGNSVPAIFIGKEGISYIIDRSIGIVGCAKREIERHGSIPREANAYLLSSPYCEEPCLGGNPNLYFAKVRYYKT